GIPEVIRHGETGFVGPIGDIETLAKHTLTLLRDDALRQQFRLQALHDVEERFSSEKIVQQYEDIYRTVVERVAEVQ
ncbi:MAG: N-acetyl-alpha-D-glucosaminyl L-malate synthase BshA, partial [Bacilli bacterium]